MYFTRHGFWELLIGTLVLVLLAATLGYFTFWWLALLLLPVLIWLFAFFRDPERVVPTHEHIMVSPADGVVSDVTEIENHPIFEGPCVCVGIFLSVFNVHINRSPCEGVVTGITYKKGKFVNALNHRDASEHNESNTIVISEPQGEGRPVAIVKQIVGLIARRIICTKAINDVVARGERIGMIKFGSRTELYVPRYLEPQVKVKVGQKVRAGTDVLLELGKPFGSSGTVVEDPEATPLERPTPT